MQTTVIHVKDMKSGDTYIGRAVPRQGFHGSPWANPVPLRNETERAKNLDAFDHWVRTSDDSRAVWIRDNLEQLRGHRLGCWCKKPHRVVRCHGDTYVAILNERKTG